MNFIRIFKLFFISSAFCACANSTSYEKNYEFELAKAGDLDAQYNLAMDYLYGENGKIQSAKKALYWFKKTADLGDASAQNNLAILYAEGRGVDKNDSEAEKYFKMAAEQNHPNGLVQTARRILSRNNAKEGKETAINLLEKAAEQKNNDAYLYLSKLYLEENNLNDKKKGILWLEKSANLGDSESMMKLYEYYQGNENFVDAEKWLKKAYAYRNKEAIKIFDSKNR